MALRGAFWEQLGKGIMSGSAMFGQGLQTLREQQAQAERDRINAELTQANIKRVGIDTQGAELDQAEKTRKAEMDKAGRLQFTEFMGREKGVGTPSFIPAGDAGVPMLGGLQLTPEQQAADAAAQKSALERLYSDPNFAQFGATPEAKQYEAGLLGLENLKDKDLDREQKFINAGVKKGVKTIDALKEEWTRTNGMVDNMKQDALLIKAKQVQTYLPAMDAVWTNLSPEEKKDKMKTAPVDNALMKFSTLIMEPGLAVREDDLRLAVGGQSKLDEIRQRIKATVEGGLGFTPEFRTAMVDVSRKIYNVVMDNYKTRLDFYDKMANRFQIATDPKQGGIFDSDQWKLINKKNTLETRASDWGEYEGLK